MKSPDHGSNQRQYGLFGVQSARTARANRSTALSNTGNSTGPSRDPRVQLLSNIIQDVLNMIDADNEFCPA